MNEELVIKVAGQTILIWRNGEPFNEVEWMRRILTVERVIDVLQEARDQLACEVVRHRSQAQERSTEALLATDLDEEWRRFNEGGLQ